MPSTNTQVNFRLTSEEYRLVKEYASAHGLAVPTLAKQLLMRIVAGDWPGPRGGEYVTPVTPLTKAHAERIHSVRCRCMICKPPK